LFARVTAERSSRRDRELVHSIDSTLDVLQGRWKVRLLFLMARGIHRHNKLLRALPGTSKKVMTDTLRALERDGLVERRVVAGPATRVEYSLTGLGWSISAPLMALAEWGAVHENDVEDANAAYRPSTASARS
jgi:DNA-binding HxlR family transcriptional regulator